MSVLHIIVFELKNLNWEICVWSEDPGWTVHYGAEETHFFSTKSENNVLNDGNGELRYVSSMFRPHPVNMFVKAT